MAKKHLPLVVSLQFLLALTLGCGSSNTMPPPPPAPKSEFLYLMTFQPPAPNARLMTFKLDPTTGILSSPSTMAVPLTFGVAVDPTSRFLYSSDGNFLAPAINIFSIDPKTGSLAPDGTFLLTSICNLCPPASAPGALAIDAKGAFLYYGSSSFGNGLSEEIGGLSVTAATGTLNLVTGSPFPADDVPFGVLVHPSGHFFYTENTPNALVFPLPLRSVSGFSIDPSTGALAPMLGSPFTPPVDADLTAFAIHPTGKFMYASAGSAANGIVAWNIDSTTGSLTALAASPFATGTTLYGVTITPSGKFLYSPNGANGGISGFTIDSASGALAPISGSPFDASVWWGECVIDPSGKLLVAVDGKNKAIELFSIDSSTGALTRLGNPTPIGAVAVSVVMTKAPQ